MTGGSRRTTRSPTPGDALVTRYNPTGTLSEAFQMTSNGGC